MLVQIWFVNIPICAQERGAQMPYTRYESEDAVLGGGAIIHGPSYDQTLLESEASNRKYVSLTATGDYMKWKVTKEAEGMVLRFSIPDSSIGGGISRSLSMYVNGSHIANLQLTSHFAWQYFDVNNNPSNNPSVGRPRMRFDEYRMVLPDTLFVGDTIKLEKDSADISSYYGIDFIELEPIPVEITKPAGYLDVTAPPYNAVPNNGSNCFTAFNSCITAASNAHTGMYIPKGRYTISGGLSLKSNLTIQGAGEWYTELYFSSSSNGGLSANGTNVKVSDLYMECANTQRQTYRGLGGYWGIGSRVENVWLTHFETGAWIANYSTSDVTDSLVISNCRIRNTYADGCNFARGTKNSILEYCSLRNNGDDAMATWSSDSSLVPSCFGNIFRFNTIENTYRANGLGIYGGRGHIAHHCIIKDNLYDSGIKLNSVFPGHLFGTLDYLNIYDMTLDRTAPITDWNTVEGAISLDARYFPVSNAIFDSIDINGSPNNGIFIEGENGYAITDVHFSDININNIGIYGIYIVDGTYGWGEKSNIVITSASSGNIYNGGPFVFKDKGIEILTIIKTGQGDVTLSPSGGSYPAGTLVTLTAMPANGYKFDSWSGDLTDTLLTDTIRMNDYKTVTANFSVVTGTIEIQNQKNMNIVCSPNPISDQLTVTFNKNSCQNLSVLDYTGKIYFNLPVDPSAASCKIDFRSLPKGLYLLKFEGDNGIVVSKIIKD